MCDDQTANHPSTTAETGMSRRHFLQATAGAAAAGLLRRFPRLHLRSADRPVAADGTSAYSMAMHVHSSFSEQSASMDSQLFQASTNSVDVLWWPATTLAWTASATAPRCNFTSLTRRAAAPARVVLGIWTKTTRAPDEPILRRHRPVSFLSERPGGRREHAAVRQEQLERDSEVRLLRQQPSGRVELPRQSHRQSLTIDVLLTTGWTQGYLELLVTSSYHQAAGGQPAGDYLLSYRFVPPSVPASSVANGVQGVITIPVSPSAPG